MYYDLIASLPHFPHFEQADHLPITRLRLRERLRRLRPDHTEQLHLARGLVSWRPERPLGRTDAVLIADYLRAMEAPLERPLRDYVALRMDQQTLLAALRRKRAGVGLPEGANSWGAGPHVHFIRRNWEKPEFGMAHVHPWLPQASELLAAGDALGLERLLMDLNWRWLKRCAERSPFGFEAVFAYVFQWEMLQAWLTCDAIRAKSRFTELVDKVIHVERN